MPNIDLVCIQCKNGFYFSEKDQNWFAQKGFQTPKRCYSCRQARKSGSTSAVAPTNQDAESYDWNK